MRWTLIHAKCDRFTLSNPSCGGEATPRSSVPGFIFAKLQLKTLLLSNSSASSVCLKLRLFVWTRAKWLLSETQQHRSRSARVHTVLNFQKVITDFLSTYDYADMQRTGHSSFPFALACFCGGHIPCAAYFAVQRARLVCVMLSGSCSLGFEGFFVENSCWLCDETEAWLMKPEQWTKISWKALWCCDSSLWHCHINLIHC